MSSLAREDPAGCRGIGFLCRLICYVSWLHNLQKKSIRILLFAPISQNGSQPGVWKGSSVEV
jgi:hypothetical protein